MAKTRDRAPVECVEKVGKYEFTVCFGEPTPESTKRWERRSDALFAWLMEQWGAKTGGRSRTGK